jgi:hypothetical protein
MDIPIFNYATISDNLVSFTFSLSTERYCTDGYNEPDVTLTDFYWE